MLAFIDATACIGCTLCLPACPVDAILGASQQLHVVLKQECTGCGACINPCPMQCIQLKPSSEDILAPERVLRAEQRQKAKEARLARQMQGQKAVLSELLYLDFKEEEREQKFEETINKALALAAQKHPFSF